MGRAKGVRFADSDPAVQRYLLDLRPSNCPFCGRRQKTPRGEPMICPRCLAEGPPVKRPSVPMVEKPAAAAAAGPVRDINKQAAGDAGRRRR